MFNLTRYVKLGSVVRNYGATKMLFASATVHVEKKDPADTLNRPAAKKAKSEKIAQRRQAQCFQNILLDPTIAAVFQSLSEEDEGSLANITRHLSKKPDVDEIIMNAKTVNGLLKIVETYPDLDRTHALKVSRFLSIAKKHNPSIVFRLSQFWPNGPPSAEPSSGSSRTTSVSPSYVVN